jgi:hypothetical protein
MKALELLSSCGLIALMLAACNNNDKKAENSRPTTTGSTDTAPSGQPSNLTKPNAPAAAPATGVDPSITPPQNPRP